MLGCPRTNLAHARALGEIGIRLSGRHSFHATFDANLHLLVQVLPVKTHRRLRMGLQLPGLRALVIGEELKAVLIKPLEQDNAAGNVSASRQRRQVHGTRLRVTAARGFIDELTQGFNGFGVQRRAGFGLFCMRKMLARRVRSLLCLHG